MLLSFDPGKRLSGAALFDRPGGQLQDAALIRGQETGDVASVVWLAMIDALREWIGGREVTWLAVEQMVIRPGMLQAAPALMHLQAVTGGVIGVYGKAGACCALTPEQWKGQMQKRPHHTRILSKLTTRELAVLGGLMDLDSYRAALQLDGDLPEEHNLVDAIGIGMSRAVQYALLGDVEARKTAQQPKTRTSKTSNGMKVIHWKR